MNEVCRFELTENVHRETIETQLALAIVSAECAFGQPQVRISAGYFISKDNSRVVIDISTEVGEYIARLFTGLMTRAIGEDKFSVDRIGGSGEMNIRSTIKPSL
jgi:hypothetical protein